MKQIKVIIADDHDLFRGGLIELLKKNKHIDIIAGVSDGLELLDLLKKKTPDVVLLDLVMPNMDGFQVLQELSKGSNKTKVIVISMHEDGNYIAKCVKLGAYGYLLKNADEEELVSAIELVAAGKKYFNLEITEKLVNIMSADEPAYKELSNKEGEILSFLSKGYTTKEIAAELYISTRTVETHRANMLKKLKVKNSAELITKAASLKLL